MLKFKKVYYNNLDLIHPRIYSLYEVFNYSETLNLMKNVTSLLEEVIRENNSTKRLHNYIHTKSNTLVNRDDSIKLTVSKINLFGESVFVPGISLEHKINKTMLKKIHEKDIELYNDLVRRMFATCIRIKDYNKAFNLHKFNLPEQHRLINYKRNITN